ncbi:TusA-related sulfurtransferase [Atopomonas hussainii]|uniref:TusA-related sulfurtransferase n=1 Tax=Atopomonas hussainii TaxID=1429083 RepID=A0A1H7S4G8_9GAMM|nr:sulfurtransferase TusA family protein [Atopomonas hussainii]SEL67146.1 TusA-related sulfurtransferase [Atopomonas hussainii]
MSSPQLPPAWQNEAFDQALNTAGLACPLPLLKTKLALSQMLSGQVLRVVATDAGSWRDIQAFAERAGHTLRRAERDETLFCYWLQKA